ncbi:hypothetical protein T01_15175 [Trichinella spiralis]|uniref:Uncharacterized protein n=1 Tax=Trichinella spiralis TaxID=6334 RepID=A0A0V0Z0Q0_TRISP|nr:hypothetical protein T01_15175 [Trichinella spiralis]
MQAAHKLKSKQIEIALKFAFKLDNAHASVSQQSQFNRCTANTKLIFKWPNWRKRQTLRT